MICIVATIGTATIAPMTPPSSPRNRMESVTTSGLTWTVRLKMSGPRMFPSSWPYVTK